MTLALILFFTTRKSNFHQKLNSGVGQNNIDSRQRYLLAQCTPHDSGQNIFFILLENAKCNALLA